MKRTLVAGFDGATPQLLFPWLEAGELPVLKALAAGAAHGPLRSVFPPMTLPAWSSFLTGEGPGVHGIFDFTTLEEPTGQLRFVDSTDRKVTTIPEQLSSKGYRVGTFLFPTTWPPTSLSGGQISGFDSPVATRVPRSACAPPDLHDLIVEELGRELSFADFSELRKGRGWEDRAARALLQGIEDKERVACALLKKKGPYDFFAILFGESDTAAHHFWHATDPSSPRYDAKLAQQHGDLLLQVYRRLDQALGRLLNEGVGFDAVVLASDHGFGGASDRILHLGSFLHQHGLMRWKRRGFGETLAGWGRSQAARWVPPRLLEGVLRLASPEQVGALETAARYGCIDRIASAVIPQELDYAPALMLNHRAWSGPGGREGLIDWLSGLLRDWRDPIDGGPVVRAVHRKEELFFGPCVDRAADLYLELRLPGGYSYNVLPSRPGTPPVTRLPRARYRGAKGAGMSGSHRQDGVYFLQVDGVAPGWQAMDIADLLPRWQLAAEGTADLLGTVAPVGEHRAPPLAATVPKEDVAALARRLKSLGYAP